MLNKVKLSTLNPGDIFILNHRTYEYSYQVGYLKNTVEVHKLSGGSWHMDGDIIVETCEALSYQNWRKKHPQDDEQV